MITVSKFAIDITVDSVVRMSFTVNLHGYSELSLLVCAPQRSGIQDSWSEWFYRIAERPIYIASVARYRRSVWRRSN